MKFSLNQHLRITISGETGLCVGRAEYTTGIEPQYLLRYVNGTGVATEQWWGESSLIAPL